MEAMGGGDPLTTDQLQAIEATEHISSTTMTLTDQLSSDDASIESSQEFGGFVRGGFEQIQSNATQVTASLTPEILLSSTGLTLLIALIGTALPAWFTARVRPAEVLRTE